MTRMSLAAAVTLACMLAGTAAAQTAPAVEYYRLVPGFLPEHKNENGTAIGTGFATPNPWGAYTAYLMATNAKGQRTWRIENYLQQANMTQGSTMYLLEGSARALLIDTAQNTPEEMGKSDLKTVVRHLLGHNNDGSVKSNPVDFIVAISHGHGDHTGKNSQMSDRTVYFPDLDWPRAGAPPNYVPIKEGGGASEHGSGKAVGEIDLGGRTLRIIDIHGHTPGSVGFLDAENNMIMTSDAIGSGCVWAHFGTIAVYAESVRHLREVLKPLDNPAILPGHFYQIASGARGKPPLNGRPLDKQYVDDQLAAAEGVLNGTIKGEPYAAAGRGGIMVARYGSAEMTFNPAAIHAPAPAPAKP
jgi:glyoxylase-like metal-dependent hydrolase (beta-lactamase superfamily II)